MANKSLFASLKSRLVRADARNEAGGRAYKLDAKHALAQLAATGCFNGTFYVAAD
jgi:60 kDa SS-A/Ro ribonucleoprotein